MSKEGFHKWEYRWVTGVPGDDEDAQMYGEEIQKIMDSNEGGLTKSLLVENAKSSKSPLHDYFDWDDTIAAKKWRVRQAGKILRSIEVVFSETFSEPIRAFVNIMQKDDTERLFIPINSAMSNDDIRGRLLERLKKEAISWARRARKFEEFADIIVAIDKNIAQASAEE
jgi:tRNA A37 N6-isopentenylltransferase MiaA